MSTVIAQELGSDLQLGSKDDIYDNGFIRLSPRTHDIAFTDDHISGIEKLAADLDEAVKAAWPTRHGIRYSQVHVLMISWEDDDLGVESDLGPLRKVLALRYNFEIHEYKIPSDKPDKSLKRRVSEFLDHDDKYTLLIVYYAGHARCAMQANEAPLWFANRESPTPAVPSGGIQSMLEEADSDVLLLFDCCHSAALPTLDSRQGTSGVVEVIAACGYESIAAAVDKHSFTRALTEILAIASKGAPFSVGELHARVLSKLKCWAPDLLVDDKGDYRESQEGNLIYEHQPRRTPIYSILSGTNPRRSILLGTLPHSESSVTSGEPTPSLSSTASSSTPGFGSTDTSSRKRKWSLLDTGSAPCVILAVRLDEGGFDKQHWLEWIRDAPVEARDISIEGRYDSFSTLLLVRMSVATWNLMPSNPAYSFIGFVTSTNLADMVIPACSCVKVCQTCLQRIRFAKQERLELARHLPKTSTRPSKSLC